MTTTLIPHYRALVLDWARARQIIPNGKAHVQLMKTGSELGELFDAEIKGDHDGIVDGIGDVLVTLIIFAELAQVEWPEEIAPLPTASTTNQMLIEVGIAYGDLLSNRTLRDVWVTRYLAHMLGELLAYANMKAIPLDYCLAAAYNEIKDRKGTMMPNGLFVKESA